MKTEEKLHINLDILNILNPEQAWAYHIVPKSEENGCIELYIDENKLYEGADAELEILLGKKIQTIPTQADVIQKALNQYYRKKQRQNNIRTSEPTINSPESFLNSIICEARELGSSDIHFEMYEGACRVRIRIDGNLVEKYKISKEEYEVLVNKIKIESNLLIEEKRLPQDGKIEFNHNGYKFDIRVSTVPVRNEGEKAVLRILDSDASQLTLTDVGFSEIDLKHYQTGIKKTQGIVLISGPTGSGKTTTLYATLKQLNQTKTNILTVEDPIEYTLAGINQVQLRENIGLTFARVLKSFLRQDPDIIMVGEIRDKDTAEIAIRAALTGHLVLSTIHTNSAWGIVSRMIDMGIPAYQIAATLNTAVAQRLLKCLCPECKEKSKEEIVFPKGFTAPYVIQDHYIAKGCEYCYFTGYKGRKAIYEVIPIDAELAHDIKNNIFNVDEYLKSIGIKSLKENAFEWFALGETSLDEIYPILLNN